MTILQDTELQRREQAPSARRRDEVPDLQIRRARRTDMSQIAAFVRSSAEWYRPFVDESDMAEHEVDEAWEEKNFTRRDFYIGHADGDPVGTISLQYFGDFAYLGYIYLDVAHVGKGYGQTLMRFAESVARRMGMDGMVLIAHPQATWAKKAYLKYGFEIIAEDRDDVCTWQNGCLDEYYEEGFQLYRFTFEGAADARIAEAAALEVS